LLLAYEKRFSQSPVVEEGGFPGLVTENAIVRWMGQQAHSPHRRVDLEEVHVKHVIGRDERGRNESNLEWASNNSPEDEAMSRFLQSPVLEVVLPTHDGHRGAHLSGIVTQWDAARYSPRR
jgi:hypothetical protein